MLPQDAGRPLAVLLPLPRIHDDAAQRLDDAGPRLDRGGRRAKIDSTRRLCYGYFRMAREPIFTNYRRDVVARTLFDLLKIAVAATFARGL